MHIHECRKSHPTNDMETCPFNAAHVFPSPERRWHILTCPDRHQVHGKIVQDMTGSMGCVETPSYVPLDVHGDSWEERRRLLQSGRQPLPKRAPQSVHLAQEEVEGLNPRERQKLYLQKKKEAEEVANNPQSFLLSQRDALPARSDSRGPSRSMALFQQHTEHDDGAPPHDIYKRALRVPPKSGSMGRGVGRGCGTTEEGPVPQANRPGLLERGQGQTMNIGPLNQSPFAPIGRGAGGSLPYLPRERNSGDAPFQSYADSHDPVMSVTNVNSYSEDGAVPLPGRGQAMGMVRAEFPAGGRGAGLMPGGRGAPGVWQGGAAPPSVGALAHRNEVGLATNPSPAGVRIPFSGVTSQPESLVHLFGDMAVSGLAGRGRGVSTVYTEMPSEQRKETTSESEDQEQFVDAVPWVGEGYGPEVGSGEREPVSSSSSLSLMSGPPAIDDLVGEPSEQPVSRECVIL